MQFTILMALSIGYGPDDDAAAAIAIAKASIKKEQLNVKPTPKADDVPPFPKYESVYMNVMDSAAQQNRHAVIFVGHKGTVLNRDIGTRLVGGSVDSLEGFPAKCVVVCEPNGKGWMNWKATLPADATDKQIADAVKGVTPTQDPFDKSVKRDRRRADGDSSSPWSPQSEQDYIRKLWPEGVEFPDTLKFYSLPKASQRIATTNDRPSRGFHLLRRGEQNINLEFPYVTSGGMDQAEVGAWRNVTGLAIPEGGKIKVWAQRTPILNSFGSYQQEEMLFWKFPSGTQAYDVLIRKNDDGSEHIFTIRVRERDDKGWDSGLSYFPSVEVGETQSYVTAGNTRTRDVIGVEKVVYKVAEVKPLDRKRYLFKPRNTAISDDGHFFPKGFKGTGLSCTQCHVKGMMNEASPYAGPALRGQDSVFSFFPTRVDSIDTDYYTPRIDHRWPLEIIGRVE
jgi:hypothetical protein